MTLLERKFQVAPENFWFYLNYLDSGFILKPLHYLGLAAIDSITKGFSYHNELLASALLGISLGLNISSQAINGTGGQRTTLS